MIGKCDTPIKRHASMPQRTAPRDATAAVSRRSLLARAAIAAPALMLLARQATAAAAASDPSKFAAADAAIDAAVGEGQIPGAVLCAGRKGGHLYLKAYGNRALEPAKVAMTEDTVFDLASL